MDRRALLIGSPGVRDGNFLPGVAKDLQNYNEFLTSPLGGVWYTYEIETLRDPSAAEVRIAVRRLKAADYSLVLFSGHGYHLASKGSTIVCLRDDEEIVSADLCVGAPKHTLLLDCCRKVVTAPTLAEDALAKMDTMAAARRLNTDNCHYYYDKVISECTKSLITLYSCDVDELSNEDSRRGGHYAYSLIDEAETWAENNRTDLTKNYATFRIPRARERASEAVHRLSGDRQHPQIARPRSEPYFPFAIVA